MTIKSAVLSDDGLYRYDLQRRWGTGGLMTFVMLNPSTADADVDDPTIRRCIGFAKREGLDGIRVVNRFGFRATDPKNLRGAIDATGPGNREAVVAAVVDAGNARTPLVAAWGAWRNPDTRRLIPVSVKAIASAYAVPLLCLGTTKHGDPRHPLYLPCDAPLTRLDSRA